MFTRKEVIEGRTSSRTVPSIILLSNLFSEIDLVGRYQNVELSFQKLSTWLDLHSSESNRFELIAGTLQRYISIIRHFDLVSEIFE